MRIKTIISLLITFLAIVTMGAVQTRQNWLTRGLADGLPEPVLGGSTQLGLNVDLTQYDDTELAENLAQIQALGVRVIKHSFHYAQNYNWTTSDRLIEAATNEGLTIVPLLDGNPANAFAPVNRILFAEWAGEFAHRYDSYLQHYIIWDEPNLASHWGNEEVNANEYAALLTDASTAIRAVDDDAIIISAPLAPTVETGPLNLSDATYLRALYEAGAADAFDIVGAKPYGFDHSPEDRDVQSDILNFSHIILLREEMVQNGDGHKGIWAGNWGWNSLPPNWTGEESVWEDTTPLQKQNWTLAGLQRAQQEWDWMGVMFLEHWEPNVPPDDAHWGFAVKGSETAVLLQNHLAQNDPAIAQTGFHLATDTAPAQSYTGGWEFSPEFGADISETVEDEPNDRVSFTFYGTDVGIRVRRADFRARLYVTIDGQPANGLPSDENGTTLILTSPDSSEDYITTEAIARNLPLGRHTVEIEAARGWDQWALHGFSVGYAPDNRWYVWSMLGLGLTAVFSLIYTIRTNQNGLTEGYSRAKSHFLQWHHSSQLATTAAVGLLMGWMGWLTWGANVAGMYRRWGDGAQLAVTAVTATLFYATPTFFIYAVALLALFLLISFRPVWGLALIAFSFPLYVSTVTKAVGSLNFSLVEIFTLVTFGAVIFNWVVFREGRNRESDKNLVSHRANWAVTIFVAIATASLFFTERLDVATNEWRLVIIEPALFYLLFRAIRPSSKELWVIWDAFVAGGVLVAAIGLWQYAFVRESLITAEAGLLRLKSIYGSPNNVALYLERVLMLLTAVFLFGQSLPKQRRQLYAIAIIPIGLAILLTFSKGGLLLGVPMGLAFIFWRWQAQNGRLTWPWLIAAGVLGIAGLFIAQQIPQLAGRLNLTGATGIFRLNLWGASLQMIGERPFFGVGLDNFLYAYRGRYIFETAWQEPNLNHPHNILLDFATRLGILGLLAGSWLFWQLGQRIKGMLATETAVWQPLIIALGSILTATLAHGLVDHSFFLVDLAFVFYLMLGTAVSLEQSASP